MNNGLAIGVVIVIIILVIVAAYFLGGNSAAYNSLNTSTTAKSSPITFNRTTSIGSTITLQPTPPTTTISNITTPNSAVRLESSSTFGDYLTNQSGFTLYTYGNDVPNSGASTCVSSCATAWPPFYSASLTVSPGLNLSEFKTITRTGGALQLTYKGYPLYLFQGDHAANQINGNGVGAFKVATK